MFYSFLFELPLTLFSSIMANISVSSTLEAY